MDNVGKKFETKFKEDFNKLDGSICIRQIDVMSGNRGVNTFCDFVCYQQPYIYLIDCKTHKGASFPFSAFVQAERMKPFVGKPGVRCGAVVWLYEHDVIFYLPVSTVLQLQREGKKSINYKELDKYNVIIIPSEKRRTFFDSDYSVLQTLQDGD